MIKNFGYYECFEKVKKARTSKPINTTELEAIRNFYGVDLYAECLRDVLEHMEQNDPTELPDFNSPEAYFCEPD